MKNNKKQESINLQLETPPDKKHNIKILFSIIAPFLVFAVIGFAIYSNILNAPFTFDDAAHIVDNTHIRIKQITPQGLSEAAFKSPSPQRPVANISFALNYLFSENNPAAYHITNIIIHIITASLIYLLFRHTLKLAPDTKQIKHTNAISFAASLLWLINPLQIQSVTYTVQRMNSLAAMFFIASLLFYIKARLAQKSNNRSWYLFAVSFVSAILAFGCKENTAILPFIILFYEWFFFQNARFAWLKTVLPVIILSIVLIAILAALYLGSNASEKLKSEYVRWGLTVHQRLLTQSRVVFFYLSLFFFPHPSRLNLDHDFPLSYSLFNPPTTILAIFLIAALIASAIILAKRNKLLISFCILWYFSTLLIESSFIGIEITYEHRLYLPSIFVTLLAVLLGYYILRSKYASIPVLIAISIILSLWTYSRNNVWADERTLWKDCAQKSPHKARSLYNLAISFFNKKQYPEAAAYYSRTLQIDPNRFDAYEGLAFCAVETDDPNKAVEFAGRALKLNPKSAKAHLTFGRSYYKKQELQKALDEYNIALSLDPRLHQAYNGMGTIYYGYNKYEDAKKFWEKALKIKPDYPEALNNLAWLLATSIDKNFQNPAKACQLAEYACKITNFTQPDLLDTLAAAYAQAGDFKKAIETATKAIRLAKEKQNMTLADQISQRLNTYKNNKPWFEKPPEGNIPNINK